jgi:hypothetical protein
VRVAPPGIIFRMIKHARELIAGARTGVAKLLCNRAVVDSSKTTDIKGCEGAYADLDISSR